MPCRFMSAAFLGGYRLQSWELPFDPLLPWQKTAINAGNIGFQELRDYFEITFLTAKIRFANLIFALPPGPTSHLPAANLVYTLF